MEGSGVIRRKSGRVEEHVEGHICRVCSRPSCEII